MATDIDHPRKVGLPLPVSAADAALVGATTRSWQLGDKGATAVVVIAILVAMQIGSAFIPPYILPSPVMVAKSLFESLTTDYLHILVTIVRLLICLLISIAVGTAIGIITGTVASVRPYLRALVIIDTGIPALSWMLMAVFWFKDPEIRMFFIMFVIVVPIYALNVHDGIRAMSKEWLEMCESFRPSRWQVLRYLILPHIVPYVLMTTKSTVGYATRMYFCGTDRLVSRHRRTHGPGTGDVPHGVCHRVDRSAGGDEHVRAKHRRPDRTLSVALARRGRCALAINKSKNCTKEETP